MLTQAIVLLTVLANIILAYLVYKKNTRSATNILLANLSFVLASWVVSNYLSLNVNGEAARLFWVKVVMAVTTPFGPLLFLLAHVFPEKKLRLSNWVLIGIALLGLVIVILAFSPYMFLSLTNLPDGSFQLVPGPAIALYAVNLLGFMTAGFFVLIRKYRHSTGMLKKQLALFLGGVLISFSIMTFTNFLAVILFQYNQLAPFGPSGTLIMVATMAYAIIRHQFLDIKLLIVRSLAYTLLVSIVAFLYVGAVFFVEGFVSGRSTTLASLALPTLVGLVVTFSFQFLQRQIEKVTENIFYRKNYNRQKLLEKLTHIMASTLELEDVIRQVLTQVQETLKITRISVALIDDHRVKLAKAVGGQPPQEPERQAMLQLAEYVFKETEQKVILLEEMPESPLKDLMRNYGYTVVLALIVKSELFGGLFLSDKSSGELYSSQDLEVMNILAPEFAVSIHNALSYAEVRSFNVRLKKEVEGATSELRAMNQRLENLDKLKDEFSSIASHQLRTPLGSMRWNIEMLLNEDYGELSAQVKQVLKQVNDSNSRMIVLVNDLLSVSRIDQGRLQNKPEPINCLPIIQSAVDEMMAEAKKRHITLTVQAIDFSMPQITVDPKLFREVIQNLLSNAVKYNVPEGNVVVSLLELNHTLQICVADEGIGIPEKEQSHLFAKFFRAENAQLSQTEGTGLGLFVVKSYVESWNGRVWCESPTKKRTEPDGHEVGYGTTFCLVFPVAMHVPPTASVETPSPQLTPVQHALPTGVLTPTTPSLAPTPTI